MGPHEVRRDGFDDPVTTPGDLDDDCDVVLDGTGSTDPDGTIVSYTWTGSPDPDDIAQPTVHLPAGVHTFSLVVTDNDGNDSDADTVTITVTERAENGARSGRRAPEQGMGIDADGRISWTPEACQEGGQAQRQALSTRPPSPTACTTSGSRHTMRQDTSRFLKGMSRSR